MSQWLLCSNEADFRSVWSNDLVVLGGAVWPCFTFISQPGPAITSTLMLSLVHIPALTACYFTHRQLGTKRLSPCLHLAILHSRLSPLAAKLDEYRGCSNPTLEKSQRKLRRVPASEISLDVQISFVTLVACRESHLQDLAWQITVFSERL